jgi:hypothetical protein
MTRHATSRRTWIATWSEVDLDGAWYAMLAICMRRQHASWSSMIGTKCFQVQVTRNCSGLVITVPLFQVMWPCVKTVW